jgi:ribosome-binding factor A
LSERMRKINELVREESSRAIADAVGKEVFITVTAVETSRDLRNATIWVSSFDDEKLVLSILKEKKSSIQHGITSKMYAKYTPKIEFRFDRSQEHVEKIDRLLRDNG